LFEVGLESHWSTVVLRLRGESRRGKEADEQ